MATNKAKLCSYLQNINGGVFESMNLTTNQEKIIEEFKSIIGCDSSNVTSKEIIKYGSGISRFEGSEWQDGSIFIGKSQSNRYMLRFTGPNGQTACKELIGAFDLVNNKDVTVTLIDYYVAFASSEKMRNLNEFLLESGQSTSITNQPKAPSLFLDKSSLRIGGANSIRTALISPNIDKKSILFDKIRVKVSLKGSAALEFIAMIKNNTSFQDTFGFILFDMTKLLGESLLISFIRNYLKNTFNLGIVIKPRYLGQSNKSSVNPLLKYSKGACSALIKKLKTQALSIQTQDLIVEELLFRSFKDKNEIEDFQSFVKKCNEALNGNLIKSKEDSSKTTGQSSDSGTPTQPDNLK